MAADNKKKRSFRKEYLNDFRKNESGSYEYSGEFKTFEGSVREWRRDIIILWISCAVPAVILIIIGCISSSGMVGNVFLLLPYALELIALFLLIWKLVRLSYGGQTLRQYVHKSVFEQLPGYVAAAAVTAGLAIAGLIVTLILNSHTGSILAVILYGVAQLLLIAGCFAMFRILRTMTWK